MQSQLIDLHFEDLLHSVDEAEERPVAVPTPSHQHLAALQVMCLFYAFVP